MLVSSSWLYDRCVIRSRGIPLTQRVKWNIDQGQIQFMQGFRTTTAYCQNEYLILKIYLRKYITKYRRSFERILITAVGHIEKIIRIPSCTWKDTWLSPRSSISVPIQVLNIYIAVFRTRMHGMWHHRLSLMQLSLVIVAWTWPSWCQGTQPVGHKALIYHVYISSLSPALQSLYLSLFTRFSLPDLNKPCVMIWGEPCELTMVRWLSRPKDPRCIGKKRVKCEV